MLKVFPEGKMRQITFTTHIFKEGDIFVAYVPELDVSSCGHDASEARKNIQDAVRGFVQTSEETGTLKEILQEAGYRLEGETWNPPEFVSLDHATVTLS